MRLNAGTIARVDFDAPNLTYFQLKCKGKIYAMQYDVVYLYVGLDHAHYLTMKFCLPMVAPANPANEEGVIAPAKKRTTKSVWRQGNDDNDEDEEEEEDYGATPPKCNNNNNNAARKGKHTKRKTTINPDLVFGAELEFGDADNNDDKGGNEMNNNDGPTAKPI
jgi:hypothetical protein